MTVYVSDKLVATPATVTGDPIPTIEWQWLRNNQPISGATTSTYDVDYNDLNTELTVVQKAVNMVGASYAISSGTGTVSDFTPSLMYRGGANGVWYDPSDFSTMFQNAAGTVPVTAVGQPVGLMLDKSKGLVLGSQLRSSGTTALIGGATPATYNTSTGEGTAARVNPTNQSGVNFSGLSASSTYIVNISNTGTATLSIRNGGVGGTTFQILLGGASVSVYMTSATVIGITPSSDGTAISFTVVSVRELPGNHAFNPSGNSANFPVLSARYNLLTKTEDFSDAVWNKSANVTIDSTRYAAPDGTITATRITFTATSQLCSQAVPAVISGNQYTSRVWLKGTAGQTIDISTAGTDEVVTLTGNWQLYTGTKNYTTNAALIISTYGGSTAREVFVWQPDVRVANDALNQPAYQRVNTATDYDTAGFKPYLSFNGVNQWLQTNSIDFTYGDKMFVSAGVRKLSDAATAVAIEFGTDVGSIAGSFALLAPSFNGGNSYRFGSRGGSSSAYAGTGVFASAPDTAVLSGIGNISGNTAVLRRNGIQVAADTSTIQGTGNYGNYPLYIGARAGSSLWFNGRLYGLVVVGKQARTVEISSTERYLNQKTGAY